MSQPNHDAGNKPQPTLIDVHAHYIPDFYREAAIAAGHAQPDGMPAIPPWSEAEMLATMDEVGIGSAILSISSPGVHFGDDAAARVLARKVNEEGARLRDKHPTRFGYFAALPLPDVEGSLAELDYAFDVLGADGVMLETNHHGCYPADPRFAPVLEAMNKRKVVMFMHPTSPYCSSCTTFVPGLPRPFMDFMFETARAVTGMILDGTFKKYPELKLIVPHAGATMPMLADRIAFAARIVPFASGLTPDDVYATLRRFYYDMAGAPLPRLLPALRTLADADHLFYGSDWPFTPAPAVKVLLGQLDAVPDDGEWSNAGMRRGNAEKLFPRFACQPCD
jgi:predicted TIM-barrel fold metal-dependent hydrolase